VQSRFDRLYPEFQRMRVLFADAYPRDIYRCLKEGYVLGSAMDVHRLRHANQRSQAVTVFGERRGFLTGPLRVALRCRTPVLQAFLLPDTGLRYRLEIVDTLLDPDRVSDEDSAVSAALDRYCRNVERCVRAHPSLITRIG
jgi:predicted LPLAT superfamily acyltransferase